jgi:Escherichia/Staphylococcus phage prohead protease
MPNILERRTLPEIPELVTRADASEEVIRITGYGAVVNKPYKVWGVTEVVAPGAFTKTLQENPDIRAMFNHDPNFLLGRTKSGTMDVTEDDRGLKYEIRADPQDPQAVSVARKIARKDVDGSSMAFFVHKDTWETDKQGRPTKRTIQEVELIETGPVTMPASPSTTAKIKRAAQSVLREDITTFLMVMRSAGFELTEAELTLLEEPEPAKSHSESGEPPERHSEPTPEASTLRRAAWKRRRRLALCT